MEEQEKEQERKKENAKKAAEYIRRLRDGTIPEFEVHFTFSNSGKKKRFQFVVSKNVIP